MMKNSFMFEFGHKNTLCGLFCLRRVNTHKGAGTKPPYYAVTGIQNDLFSKKGQSPPLKDPKMPNA